MTIARSKMACITFPALLLAAATSPAWAGAWSGPVTLSTGGEGWQAAAGLDAAGDSLAIWDERTLGQDRIWSRYRPSGGPWQAHVAPSRVLQLNPPSPQLSVAASGFATAIWADSDGLWTADHAANGGWGTAQLLVPGLYSATLLMNHFGDAAVYWGVGGARSSSSSVLVMRRPAGGTWGTAQVAVSGVHIIAPNASLSDNGDLLIAWESFDAVCKRRCQLSKFSLHASRQRAGSSQWVYSGVIAGPDPASHAPLIAVDAAGGAGMVFKNATASLASVIQPGAGKPWSVAVTIYTSASFINAGFRTDSAGDAAVVVQDAGTSKIFEISGHLGTNLWSAPVLISGTDQSPSQVIFAEGANGAMAVVWAASDPNYSTNTIRVVLRRSQAAAWSAPHSLATTESGAPEAVDVNGAGDAVVVFSSFVSLFPPSHAEYASNYSH